MVKNATASRHLDAISFATEQSFASKFIHASFTGATLSNPHSRTRSKVQIMLSRENIVTSDLRTRTSSHTELNENAPRGSFVSSSTTMIHSEPYKEDVSKENFISNSVQGAFLTDQKSALTSPKKPFRTTIISLFEISSVIRKSNLTVSQESQSLHSRSFVASSFLRTSFFSVSRHPRLSHTVISDPRKIDKEYSTILVGILTSKNKINTAKQSFKINELNSIHYKFTEMRTISPSYKITYWKNTALSKDTVSIQNTLVKGVSVSPNTATKISRTVTEVRTNSSLLSTSPVRGFHTISNQALITSTILSHDCSTSKAIESSLYPINILDRTKSLQETGQVSFKKGFDGASKTTSKIEITQTLILRTNSVLAFHITKHRLSTTNSETRRNIPRQLSSDFQGRGYTAGQNHKDFREYRTTSQPDPLVTPQSQNSLQNTQLSTQYKNKTSVIFISVAEISKEASSSKVPKSVQVTRSSADILPKLTTHQVLAQIVLTDVVATTMKTIVRKPTPTNSMFKTFNINKQSTTPTPHIYTSKKFSPGSANKLSTTHVEGRLKFVSRGPASMSFHVMITDNYDSSVTTTSKNFVPTSRVRRISERYTEESIIDEAGMRPTESTTSMIELYAKEETLGERTTSSAFFCKRNIETVTNETRCLNCPVLYCLILTSLNTRGFIITNYTFLITFV